MKINSFSIVVGTMACNADCPFCVAKMTGDAKLLKTPEVNWAKFNIAKDVVKKAANGLVTVLLTGKGEPTLFPDQISAYLNNMAMEFPIVELQTNGTRLTPDLLKDWAQIGLTGVCISVSHDEPAKSNQLMGIRQEDFCWMETATMIKGQGLLTRVNLTLQQGGIASVEDIDRFIAVARQFVDQITIRELAAPERTEDQEVADWVNIHHASVLPFSKHVQQNPANKKLLTLSHGAEVFDIDGQNVCINNCLTETTNPEDIRQLIFFPDGRLSYSWTYADSARIL